MAGSIFDAFNEAKQKSRKKAASKDDMEPVNENRDKRPEGVDGTLRLKASEVKAMQDRLTAGTEEEEDHRRSRRGRRRRGNGPVIASLLPGAPRRQVKKALQKPSPVSTVPRYPHLRESKTVTAAPPVPVTTFKVEPGADLIWSGGYQDSLQLLKIEESNGIPEQMPGPLGRDRELVVGLDFGTSCVKVVVGDRGASKAYAVPFLDAAGVNAYLLPSRLFEQSGTFSLSEGPDVHRDLKLRFLANPTTSHLQETLVGFLALVIRRCRAWLFAAHADTLAKRKILWTLVLGRAVDRAQNDQIGHLMADVLNAAWQVAGSPGMVDRLACNRELAKYRAGETGGEDSPEVSVVPELAAQIYGFVKSRQFDPRAKNFYLFVDVGAGTVDVSLFRVKANEFGTWDFSLFTSVVEPNGAMNLHRARLDWWRQQLLKLSDSHSVKLMEKLDAIQTPTEQTQPIPEKYLGYFKGMQVQFSGGALSPDDMFYMNRLVSQVRGQGIHRTVQAKIVGRVDLDHLPFFLCGGGSRLPLYRNIASALDRAPEFTWLKAHRRDLGIPSELDAPGLAQIDYDRLSVAFGLSYVDVGTVAVAKAMPSIKQSSKVDWRSGYPDKDVC